MRATQAGIERVLRAGMKSGLTPTSTTQHPDGTVVIHWGGVRPDRPDDPKEDWKDV